MLKTVLESYVSHESVFKVSKKWIQNAEKMNPLSPPATLRQKTSRGCAKEQRSKQATETYLAGALYALHDDEEDGDPGKQKAENYPPLDPTRRVHGRRNVEGGAIPEVSRLATLLTFRNCRTVFPFRTTRPWQWTLKYREHFNGLLKVDF